MRCLVDVFFRNVPSSDCTGMSRIIQMLKGKKAAKFRHNMASLLEKYLDADMVLYTLLFLAGIRRPRIITTVTIRLNPKR